MDFLEHKFFYFLLLALSLSFPLLRSFEEKDNEDYQTIYARESGSIAAPTAGLHFTDKLLAKIKSKDINIENINILKVLWKFNCPINHLRYWE